MGRARRAGPARLEKEAGWAENCNPQPVLTHPVWPAGLVGCRRAGAGQPASQQLKKKKKQTQDKMMQAALPKIG